MKITLGSYYMYLTKAVSAYNYVDSLPHAQESPRVLF